ncbi:MAG: hypothetical protein WCT48_05435, partial [Candidatus Paceibacterota bacterium]
MDLDLQTKQIIETGDYEKIRAHMRSAGLMNKRVAELRELYAERFKTRGFEPERKIWEMMAIEDLYDAPTAKHGVRTLEQAHDIITKILVGPHGERLQIESFLEGIGVTLRDIHIATLGHDIGKLKIPLVVLHNTLTDEDMDGILTGMIGRDVRKKEIFERIGFDMEKDKDKSAEEILSQLHEKGLRAVNVVPLSEAFPEEEHPGFNEILEKRGFSPEQTIKQIAVIHESAGQEIFESEGEPVAAYLVGHHHNYKKEPDSEIKYKIKISALHAEGLSDEFGLNQIIKIADSLDSLQSARPYKKAMTKLSALAELAHQADAGRIEKRILYLWASNEYAALKEKIMICAVDEQTLAEDKKSSEQVEK